MTMTLLEKIEKAVLNKTPLPEFNDFTLWREVFHGSPLSGKPTTTQCVLAIWFCESPKAMSDIVKEIEKYYPDYYLQSVLPYALARAIIEEWSVVACDLIIKLVEHNVPFHGIIESLIKMPREAFVGQFDPRAQMLPARQPYQLR